MYVYTWSQGADQTKELWNHKWRDWERATDCSQGSKYIALQPIVCEKMAGVKAFVDYQLEVYESKRPGSNYVTHAAVLLKEQDKEQEEEEGAQH